MDFPPLCIRHDTGAWNHKSELMSALQTPTRTKMDILENWRSNKKNLRKILDVQICVGFSQVAMHPDLPRRWKTSLCNEGPEQTKHLPIEGSEGARCVPILPSHRTFTFVRYVNQTALRTFTPNHQAKSSAYKRNTTDKQTPLASWSAEGDHTPPYHRRSPRSPPAEKEVPGKTLPSCLLFT